MILNLKQLNSFVEYHHFKMDTLTTAIKMMRKGCYMASVDLKDAYYTVPIAAEHQKFLKFLWRGCMYKFTCLPNGLACAPRVFTKLLKPLFATLRKLGHLCFGYIDDTYLQGDTSNECSRTVDATVDLFSKVGFITRPDKSVLIPTQKLVFLGFILDSLLMLVRLTPEKATKVKNICFKLISTQFPSLQEIAEVIGILVSSFPGVAYGPLYYRALESAKCAGLRASKGNYSFKISLPLEAKRELQWWIDNVETATNPISRDPPQIFVQSDASLIGWGAVCDNVTTGGRWTAEESQLHINVLELQAAFFALQSLCSKESNTHIQLQLDNTTAVSYINAISGNKSPQCNKVSHQIWVWAIEHNIWLSATHLPGTQNVIADRKSRVFNDNTEWMLEHSVFISITRYYGVPDIDLFLSRLNSQLSAYVSWQPDPYAKFIDAFSIDWHQFKLLYAFPPFSMINNCLQKLDMTSTPGIFILPLWPTQPWFTRALQMLVATPLLLPQRMDLLRLPNSPSCHPLAKKMRLMALKLSNSLTEQEAFRQALLPSSSVLGEMEADNNIAPTLNDGFSFVVKGKLIHFVHLQHVC